MTQITFPNGTPMPKMLESLITHHDNNNNNNMDTKKTISTTLSVMSMNLLAPIYVRPIDRRTGTIQPFAAFEWVVDDDNDNNNILDWESRKLRLLESLVHGQADIICLQELQLERNNNTNESSFTLPQWLKPIILTNDDNNIKDQQQQQQQQYYYTAVLPDSKELEKIAQRNLRVLGVDAAVTCAILVRTTNNNNNNKNVGGGWDIVSPPPQNATNSTNHVSVCLKHSSASENGERIDPVVVSSVHLDATDEFKRINQLTKCLQQANVLIKNATTTTPSNKIRPLMAILAGDMNAEFSEGSCMSAILEDYDDNNNNNAATIGTRGGDDETKLQRACAEALRLDATTTTPSKQQLDQWRMLQKEAHHMVQDLCVSIRRVDTGDTRCAYEHATSMEQQQQQPRRMETWKLDHMLYTSNNDDDDDDGLVPIAKWATLEDDPESCTTGLPNHKCPSDHLPIATIFKVTSTTKTFNDNDKQQQVLDPILALCTRHKQAIHDLELAMETKHQALLKRLAEAASANSTTNSQQQVDEDSIIGRPKKKNKKKKEVPPKEVSDSIREKRALMKQLKEEQAQERELVVRNLGNWERLLLQDHFGIGWRKWVKKGPS
eukprot:scaffold4095_cov117-Cylindrotheca_fusiformis.AAC.16